MEKSYDAILTAEEMPLKSFKQGITKKNVCFEEVTILPSEEWIRWGKSGPGVIIRAMFW